MRVWILSLLIFSLLSCEEASEDKLELEDCLACTESFEDGLVRVAGLAREAIIFAQSEPCVDPDLWGYILFDYQCREYIAFSLGVDRVKLKRMIDVYNFELLDVHNRWNQEYKCERLFPDPKVIACLNSRPQVIYDN